MKELRIRRGYKYRIYPTEEQKKYFALSFAANRWWWNYCVERIEENYQIYKSKKDNGEDVSKYPFITSNELSKICAELKKTEECSWLNGCDASSLVNSCYGTLGNVFETYTQFKKGKRGKPKFKKRGYDDSYSIQIGLKTQNIVDWKNNTLKIGKAGVVKAILHKKFNGTIKAITVSKRAYDYYEASLLVDETVMVDTKNIDSVKDVIGIDLGVKEDSNAILSDGTKYPISNEDKRLEKRIRRLQKQLSKKQKKTTDKGPSRNYIKLQEEIAKLKAKQARRRSYRTNQISSSITKNKSGLVCIEDLNVSGMMYNHHTARSTANACMGEIKRQLEYKTVWNGQQLIKVGRFYPSSQICSVCGYQNKEMKNLKIRKWVCPNCGTEHDRDVNAAINIRNEGYRLYTEGKQ